MARACLTKDEIRALIALVREAFAYIEQLHSRNRLANEIQFPKIPTLLSQSIVVHLIRDRKIIRELGDSSTAEFGPGSDADVIVRDDSRTVRVEVKGTGSRAFEHFGDKDLRADYIVWVHFGKFFLASDTEKIDVITIRRPFDFFKQGRIHLKDVEKSTAISDRLNFNLKEL